MLPYSGTATDTLIGNGKTECGVGLEDFMTIAVATGAPEKAVYAILQKAPLAIMVRGDSKFQSPKDLDGATYGGFGLPGEKEILTEIITYDGGQGDFENVTLDTAAYEAVYSKKVEFSSGYETWEIIEAELRGIDLGLLPSTRTTASRVLLGRPDVATRTGSAENPDVARALPRGDGEGLGVRELRPGGGWADPDRRESGRAAKPRTSSSRTRRRWRSERYLANSAGQDSGA